MDNRIIIAIVLIVLVAIVLIIVFKRDKTDYTQRAVYSPVQVQTGTGFTSSLDSLAKLTTSFGGIIK